MTVKRRKLSPVGVVRESQPSANGMALSIERAENGIRFATQEIIDHIRATRYLMFVFDNKEPSGGWADFFTHGANVSSLLEQAGTPSTAFQIVDSWTGEVVEQESFDSRGRRLPKPRG